MGPAKVTTIIHYNQWAMLVTRMHVIMFTISIMYSHNDQQGLLSLTAQHATCILPIGVSSFRSNFTETG